MSLEIINYGSAGEEKRITNKAIVVEERLTINAKVVNDEILVTVS